MWSGTKATGVLTAVWSVGKSQFCLQNFFHSSSTSPEPRNHAAYQSTHSSIVCASSYAVHQVPSCMLHTYHERVPLRCVCR